MGSYYGFTKQSTHRHRLSFLGAYILMGAAKTHILEIPMTSVLLSSTQCHSTPWREVTQNRAITKSEELVSEEVALEL